MFSLQTASQMMTWDRGQRDQRATLDPLTAIPRSARRGSLQGLWPCMEAGMLHCRRDRVQMTGMLHALPRDGVPIAKAFHTLFTDGIPMTSVPYAFLRDGVTSPPSGLPEVWVGRAWGPSFSPTPTPRALRMQPKGFACTRHLLLH